MEIVTKQENDDHIAYEFNSGETRILIRFFDDPNGGSGTIESNLKNDLKPDDDKDDLVYEGMIDGMESLLLALVCAGFDLSGEKGFNAIQTSLDGIGNAF